MNISLYTSLSICLVTYSFHTYLFRAFCGSSSILDYSRDKAKCVPALWTHDPVDTPFLVESHVSGLVGGSGRREAKI